MALSARIGSLIGHFWNVCTYCRLKREAQQQGRAIATQEQPARDAIALVLPEGQFAWRNRTSGGAIAPSGIRRSEIS
ncbi:MAG: hypothetical protein SVX43_16780 [Cyanobacteriota bacterium]|nr:hypothetical protein [Cyanobacteriota bacterium]